jgi:integrase
VKEATPKERRTKRRRQARAEQDGAPRYFTWAEVAGLLAAAATEQDRAMVFVTARTGLRLGEVLALRKNHVEDGWLHVPRSYDKDGTEDVPKSGRARRAPLDPHAARVLAALLDGAADDALVLPNEAGKYQHPDAVGHRFLRLQRLVDDASAARRRRREGGVGDVAGDRLNARDRLAQPGAVDDAHRFAAAGQRLGDGHPDCTGTQHHMVDGLHSRLLRAGRGEPPSAAHHWTAPTPAPVSAPPTSAAPTASTRPPTFQPMYPAIGKARATATHRQPGKDRRSDGS